jgi:hypothetical protein
MLQGLQIHAGLDFGYDQPLQDLDTGSAPLAQRQYANARGRGPLLSLRRLARLPAPPFACRVAKLHRGVGGVSPDFSQWG